MMSYQNPPNSDQDEETAVPLITTSLAPTTSTAMDYRWKRMILAVVVVIMMLVAGGAVRMCQTNDAGLTTNAVGGLPPSMYYPDFSKYDPSRDFCYKDNDNVDKFCWYPNDCLPHGNWKGEGGRGYNDCGPKCTDVNYDNDDHQCDGSSPCLPAPDTFSGISETTRTYAHWSGRTNPFETCYQLGDTDEYCWSHSYYDINYADWYECVPKPMNGAWHSIEQENMRYVNPITHPYSCGPPCQEMYQQ